MTLKIPPPPDMGRDNQRLNRWLLEIQSILNAQGLINQDSVAGLPDLIVTVTALGVNVAGLSATVTVLGGQVAGNTTSITTISGQVATLNADVATLSADIAVINGEIATLTARSQVRNGTTAPATGLGAVGDWYADTAAKHVYVKTGAATWTLIV